MSQHISRFTERVNTEIISKEKEDMLIQIDVRLYCLMSFAKCYFMFKIIAYVKLKHAFTWDDMKLVLYCNFRNRNKIFFPMNEIKPLHKNQ